MMSKSTFLKFGFLGLLALGVYFASFEVAQADPETPPASERLEILYDPIRLAEAYTSLPDTLAPEENVSPSISFLDGWTRTVFQRISGDDFDIFIVNGSNSNAVQLTSSSGADLMARLNRGNTAIAYVSGQTGDYHIYSMNANGGDIQQLTWGSSSNLLPDWSPDGAKILFDSDRDGQSEVYVMNADGSNQTRLTYNGEYDGQASWSPDGSQIVFVGQHAGSYGIWVMNADGTGQTQLAGQPYSYAPFFSPDGQMIVYSADGDYDGWFELWRMNADNSDQTQVADAGNHYDLLASGWAPDQSFSIHTRINWVSYGGAWYWRYAYREGVAFPGTNIVDMGDGIYDWRADWKTTDIEAPATTMTGLPDPSPGPIPLTWTDTETSGSGIRQYEIQTSSQPDGPWTTWQTTDQTALDYPGVGGETWYFRIRAIDQAFNTEAWPDTYDVQANVEAQPPISWIDPLPLFSRTSVPINWGGNDFGPSGIKDFTLQYQRDGGSVWVSWLPNTLLTSAIFTDTARGTYDFRIRAVDMAQNIEPWPETDYARTSFYTWALTGTVTDNTGTWLTGSLPDFQAGGVGGYASSSTGKYHAFGADQENYFLAWNRDGYTHLPLTSFASTFDALKNIVFPPENNIVTNWGLETGNLGGSGWQSTGDIPAGISPQAHTGDYSAFVGEELSFEPTYVLNSDAAHMEVDDTGNVYMMWSRYEYPQYRTTIYLRRMVNGTWYPKEAFQTGLIIGAEIVYTVEGDGTLHALWTNEQVMYYSQRSSSGVWSAPEPVAEGIEYMRLKRDDNGILHALLKRGENLIYLSRTTDGTWSAEEDLNIVTDEDLTYWRFLLGDDQTVHVVYSYDRDIFYRKRTSYGTWTEAIKISHEELGGTIYDPDARFLLNAQNLPYITYSERISDQLEYTSYLSYKRLNGTWQIGEILDPDAVVDNWVLDGAGNIHMIFKTWVAYDDDSDFYYRRLTPRGEFSQPIFLARDNSHIEYFKVMHRAPDGHILAFFNYNYDKIGYFEIGEDGSMSPIQNLLSDPTTYDLSSIVVDSRQLIHLLAYKWIGTNPSTIEYIYTHSQEALETGNSDITQEITIPADMPSPTLSYLYQLSGADAANQTSFQVHLLDDMGSTELYSTVQNTGGWVHQFHDLSPWLGETVSLVFTVHEEVGRATVSAHLDEITVGSTYPDVWINLAPTDFTILPGNTLQYTLTVRNQGGAPAENVTLTQVLPPGLTFVSADLAPTSTSPNLVWEFGTLPARSEQLSIQITLAVNPDAPTLTEVTSSASITTTTQELEPANNLAELKAFIGTRIYLPLTVYK